MHKRWSSGNIFRLQLVEMDPVHKQMCASQNPFK